MPEDYDPITAMGMDYGCSYCGRTTDNFYYIEYYILPSRLVRKRHRDKGRCELICPPCYESIDEMIISLNGVPLKIPKSGIRDMNNLYCAMCGDKLEDGDLYGLIALMHMNWCSCIQSDPLAVFCPNCVEKYTIELQT